MLANLDKIAGNSSCVCLLNLIKNFLAMISYRYQLILLQYTINPSFRQRLWYTMFVYFVSKCDKVRCLECSLMYTIYCAIIYGRHIHHGRMSSGSAKVRTKVSNLYYQQSYTALNLYSPCKINRYIDPIHKGTVFVIVYSNSHIYTVSLVRCLVYCGMMMYNTEWA